MSVLRRLAKLEAANVPPQPRPPHVLTIDAFKGETEAEARARFERNWGPIPKRHRFLVVPKKPETPEEEAEWERQFYVRQTRLRAELHSMRPKLKDQEHVR